MRKNLNNSDEQVKLCSDMGLKEAGEFALELKKAERAKEVAIIIIIHTS